MTEYGTAPDGTIVWLESPDDYEYIRSEVRDLGNAADWE